MPKFVWVGEGVPLSFPELGAPKRGEEVEIPDALVERVRAAGFIGGGDKPAEPEKAKKKPAIPAGG